MQKLFQFISSNLWIVGLTSLVTGIAVGYLIRVGQGF